MHIKKPDAQKKPDLRHGVRGTLTDNALDAGKAPPSHDDCDLKEVTPDGGVPVGQTTHG